ncbi:MAG: hypothetical protein C4K49_05530 [Candidatus Thorarchaeota archaeon]|nr:MAG: hypothetical protein C4K49_05530 [Candidatus Thorarchaeota archaeon]
MNKRSIAAVMILAAAMAASTLLSVSSLGVLPFDAADFWMEPFSSRTSYADCNAGDVLHGTFEVIQDGDLFPGDQTKYDIWLIEGVDFFIFDESNYNLWLEGSYAIAAYANERVSALSWSVRVPESGRWYVVYSNGAVFRKHVTAMSSRSGSAWLAFLVVPSVSVGCFLLGFFLLGRFWSGRQSVVPTGEIRH